MKILFRILLSTLCLSSSAIALADANTSLMEQCISKFNFKSLGRMSETLLSHSPNFNSAARLLRDREGMNYQLLGYEIPRDSNGPYQIQDCAYSTIMDEIIASDKTKLTAEEKTTLTQLRAQDFSKIDHKKYFELIGKLDFKNDPRFKEFDEQNKFFMRENSILDTKNKIQYYFIPKPITRAELCEDLKGKFHTNGTAKVDRYAFCMGTQTHQDTRTCTNQYGEPCGSQYDKSINGYALKD